ncbi:MAG: Exonuclease SbcC [candidate division TM6 bacterium GW2011_GWF2_30_66]|nr:MAG: Exonuclease SbcC [candidate division TM6 bacterium GW2011_GWF2_30_66]
MIPIRLQIKNFLSYGSELQTINFEPYQLICLSGKNGHGKSALLDSITWAVWGEARKISGAAKSDDGLLKIGQSHMMVIFDFECNKQKYRIKREYCKTISKPTANLEFGVFNAFDLGSNSDDANCTVETIGLTPNFSDSNSQNKIGPGEKLISLSEKRIRDTQKKIEDTICLSIDTFVNSAFLRQGQANEFSKKSPKDRKDIFTQILGLQQYDIVKKLANEKSKQAAMEKDGVVKFQEKIKLELLKKDDLEKQILDLENNLQEIAKQEKDLQVDNKAILINRKKLTEDQKNKQIMQFKQSEILIKQKSETEKMLETRTAWRSIHAKELSLTGQNQKKLFEQKNNLLEILDKHQKTLQTQLQLREQYIKDKENLQKIEQEFYSSFNIQVQEKKLAIEKLNIELRNTEVKLKDLFQNQLDKNTQKRTYNDNIKKIQEALDLNSITQNVLEKEENQFEKRKAHYQAYIAQGNLVKKELDALEQKHNLSQDQDCPSCPLCEQNLSASRKKFLQTKFATQKIFYTHRLARLARIIKDLKQILITQNETIKTLKTAQEKNKILQVQLLELDKNIKLIDQDFEKINLNLTEIKNSQKIICKNIDTNNKELQNILDQEKISLQNNLEYKNITENIQKNIIELKNLNYNQQEHKSAIENLKEIESQIHEFEKIKQEIDKQQERKNNIANLCISLKAIKKELYLLNEEFNKYSELENKQKELDSFETHISQKLKEINTQKENLLQNKGSLENQISKLKELQEESKKQDETISLLNAQYQDYKIISEATGKDGIQAFLIENAIPEVEQEANNILARLTNNQSQIFIESLRDLKNGGTKETLDIKISDTAGIRQYELFSGGEAFRIDFALRIAISKLLARRAGTALQTLIIDEGFGSQDEEGLTKIMDAIYKIQEDFSKIIIVSHLNSMKDQFPVHFLINKGPQGSQVSVIEQG